MFRGVTDLNVNSLGNWGFLPGIPIMYSGQLVFAQLMEHLPLHTFRRCVQRYPSKYPTKTFSHLDQFLCMAFAQLTYRESLRDIETCLRAQAQAFFIIRAKSNLTWGRLYSRAVDKSTGLRCDQTIVLTVPKARKNYPQHLRRIKFHDTEHDRELVFLTNNFDLPALTIAQLYRCRWQVELFFKWIKQHLRIKAFYGTTENAVKTQIWTAITVYVLIAIVKKRLNTQGSLYTILQILSLTLFEKTPLDQLLKNTELPMAMPENNNQLNLFN